MLVRRANYFATFTIAPPLPSEIRWPSTEKRVFVVTTPNRDRDRAGTGPGPSSKGKKELNRTKRSRARLRGVREKCETNELVADG